ncbi:MAG: hypothetical protein ACD_31C00004G0002 [uncultured bacterium]|uniref:Glycosyltransferase RgtA/B/C/D-like domain-containing protein n=4 Tax=Candidatus Daviesiibacteriota TaxID=1752718 RepID=A0A1F5K6H3_9BACT|nr:MAG: hypothetical protein ACD_31C00004G0002 [uncultured bacterium]OGE17461.1 MAG: hypothetical protein A2858_00955 [Candidatus Daviesbacteria bacterium RIFCSPHIGHO2_01_FULL_36_37]OGE36556.1 MAG: hypothetical protein A3E66_02800 [Candidatus Daviesbacteria bacterium RIFCSPHIGHO2_12_FULL_37_16]
MVNLSLILLLLLHILLLSQLKFTAWPEMLSYPYLFSNNFLPYKDFVIPYTPLLVVILSFVFNIFGFSTEVLKILTWVILLINDLIIFLILKQISKKDLLNLFILAIYIFLSSFLDGNMLWVDNTTVTPTLLFSYFGIIWIKEKKLSNFFMTAFFLSLTILIKQIAIVYLGFFIIFCLSLRKIDLKEILIFFAGLLIPIFLFFMYLISNNIPWEFYNWTLYYPLVFWRNFPGYVDFQITKTEIFILLFLLSLILLPLVNFKRFLDKKEPLFIILTLIAALIAVYPRFSFFHLQAALALGIILFTFIYVNIDTKYRNWLLAYVLLVILTVFFLLRNQVFSQEIRFYSPDDRKLSIDIERILQGEKKTYFLGLNSSQYVFTNTIPPKPWIEGFLWYMESPGVQDLFIEGLENEKPNFIFVKKPVNGNWFDLETYQPKGVMSYIFNNYSVSEIINGDIEVWKRKKE